MDEEFIELTEPYNLENDPEDLEFCVKIGRYVACNELYCMDITNCLHAPKAVELNAP